MVGGTHTGDKVIFKRVNCASVALLRWQRGGDSWNAMPDSSMKD
jgi:hypothetical protein